MPIPVDVCPMEVSCMDVMTPGCVRKCLFPVGDVQKVSFLLVMMFVAAGVLWGAIKGRHQHGRYVSFPFL
jgi:hypothetical protein